MPFDIVSRKIGVSGGIANHFAVYLGNGQVCNSSQFSGIHLDTWENFRKGETLITCHHAVIPFKKRDDIITHMAKAINTQYGKKHWYNYTQAYYDKLIPVEKTNYDLWVRNCEHTANGFVFGINLSSQISTSRSFNLKDEIAESNNKWNKLTSSDVSGLRYQMQAYIQQVDQFHQVERSKFSERVNFSPKCKINSIQIVREDF